MGKQRLFKRFFSVVMVVLLVVGMISAAVPTSVKASDTAEINTNYGIWFTSGGLIALNNVATEIQNKDGVIYSGTAKINGEEQVIRFQESGNNLVLLQLNQTTVTSFELFAGSRFTSADETTVMVLNHGKAYTKTGTENGASNWTETVTLGAAYKTVYEAAGQVGFSVTSTGGSFVNSDFVLGGGKRGWYDCTVAVGGVNTNIQVFIGSDATNGLTEISFGTDALKTAITNGTTITFPAKMELKKTGYVIALDLGSEQSVAKSDTGWGVVTVTKPTDHTPAMGIEVPESVTVLKQLDFSETSFQHSSSVGVTTENNMLVISGTDARSAQLLYSNQLSTDKHIYCLTMCGL